MDDNSEARDWDDLSASEQLQLREDYGHYLDGLPPSCDLQIKLSRFQQWLAARGVRYLPPT